MRPCAMRGAHAAAASCGAPARGRKTACGSPRWCDARRWCGGARDRVRVAAGARVGGRRGTSAR
eukprot:5819954-Prymnesium_polylepis.1